MRDIRVTREYSSGHIVPVASPAAGIFAPGGCVNAARALRLGPVFRKLSVDEIALLVAEVDALEQGLDRPVPTRVQPADGLGADELAALRAAQKRRRERDERALAQQRRRA